MLVSADFIVSHRSASQRFCNLTSDRTVQCSQTDKNYPAQNKVLGDILMLIGATLYGFSNAIEEFFIRKRPLYEVVGMVSTTEPPSFKCHCADGIHEM